MVLQTQEAFCGQRQRSCAQACTYSSTGTRPWQLLKAAAVSSCSHSARWGAVQEAGMGGAAHAPCPPRAPHIPPPPRPGLTCSEQDSGTTVSSGSSHTTSGLFTFCMFPNSTGLKGTPGGVKAFSRTGGRRGLPAPPAEAPEEALTLGEELRVGLQAVVVPAEAARVVPELTVQLELPGEGAGEQAPRSPPAAAKWGSEPGQLRWKTRGRFWRPPATPDPPPRRTMTESSRFHMSASPARE